MVGNLTSLFEVTYTNLWALAELARDSCLPGLNLTRLDTTLASCGKRYLIQHWT
jgi:hypothetical protein